ACEPRLGVAEVGGGAAQVKAIRSVGEITRVECSGVEIFDDGQVVARQLFGEGLRREEKLEGLAGQGDACGERVEHELFYGGEDFARLRVVEDEAGTCGQAAVDARCGGVWPPRGIVRG